MIKCLNCGHAKNLHWRGGNCQYMAANYGGGCNCLKFDDPDIAGTFACPICGQVFVHTHTGDEIAAHRIATKVQGGEHE